MFALVFDSSSGNLRRSPKITNGKKKFKNTKIARTKKNTRTFDLAGKTWHKQYNKLEKRICAWLEGMFPSKTVPVNMPSSHAQIWTDRGTRIKLNQVFFPSYLSHAPSLWFRHTVGRDIGNLINPFMRVTAEMTRYLATSRESQLLPPLTPRLWEISTLGQSKEWEDKELCCVCDGVWCVVVCVVWWCVGGS